MEGVSEMLLPGVLGVDAAEGGINAAGGQYRGGFVAAALADHDDLAAAW
jgi:hypothetical protein